METGDRRARRTREAIRTALGELMMEQPFERITITAVAARADIHRRTFYLHYDSLEAVARDTQEQLLAHLRTLMQQSLTEKDTLGHRLMFQVLSKLNAQRLPMMRHVSRSPGYDFLRLQMKDLFRRDIMEVLAHNFRMDETERLMVAEYFASSLIGVFSTWLKTNDDPMPPALMETLSALLDESYRTLTRRYPPAADA